MTLRRDLDPGGRVLGQRVTAGSRALLDLAHCYAAGGQLATSSSALSSRSITPVRGPDMIRRTRIELRPLQPRK